MSLRTRSTAAELMDTDCVDEADYRACLADLAAVNTVTLARRPTIGFLRRATRRDLKSAPIAVFDVAYGHGDMLRAIAAWGRRSGRALWLGGIDLNPAAAPAARAALPGLAPDLRTGDVLRSDPGPDWDFIVSSLFTHHLTDADVVAFLRWMHAHARRGWFVNDLHRHPVPFHVFRLGARLMRWHRFVQHDGPVSIARAFRMAEWRRLLAEAGVPGRVRWRFPFRICVEWVR